MNGIAPPPPPAAFVGLGDRGPDRLRLRLRQISLSTFTVLACAWCVTLGALPAILALAVAKHLLVAILAMGLDLHRPTHLPPSA